MATNAILNSNDTLLHVLQGLPVTLAFIVIICCAVRMHHEKRKDTKILMLLMTTAAGLMLVAHSSWWNIYIRISVLGNELAGEVWTLFHSLTMVIFILVSLPRKNVKPEAPDENFK